MGGEQFFVDARFVVVALEVGGGGEANEVAVAGFVFGEEDEMIVNVAAAAGGGFLFEAAAGGDIHFAADDGLDAGLAGGLVKIDRAIHHAVIGDGHAAEFEGLGLVHQAIQTTGAVEEGKLGVQMQMNKFGVRHEVSVMRRDKGRQERGRK